MIVQTAIPFFHGGPARAYRTDEALDSDSSDRAIQAILET
jgi:hypothetical protein